MSIRNVICAAVCFALFAACGGNGGDQATPTPSPPATETPDLFPTPGPTLPTAIRVAYLNLMAPVGAEEDVTVERETFEARLEIAIRQFQEFGADLVGVSEAAWVDGLGASAWTRLAQGLQLEGLFGRANPWIPGQSQEESDALVNEVGWEEGEYLLSRFPITEAKRYEIRPAPSAFESRAVLHAVVAAPEPLGEIDVYVTRFGGDEPKLALQARSLLSTITLTHDPERAIVIMGDLGAPPDSDALKVLRDAGYLDPLGANPEAVTCCRAAVRVEVAALTPTATAIVEPGTSPDPEATPEAPPVAEPGPADVSVRTDYILVQQWAVDTWRYLADAPVEQPGGQALFASDHNGIGVIFDIAPLAASNAR
jgi:endonuclease/exonuclease/phosphatase family metal-dependent hydrolase